MPRSCFYIIKFLLLFSAFIATTVSAASDEKKVTNIITDLDYGVALFHYYQGNHQQALIEFSIIEAKRKIIHQGIKPELIKGGISFSYGLYDEANEIVDRVLKEQETGQEFADTWFNSGKFHYLEGNKQAAAEAFSRIENKLSDENTDNFYYLKAQLALKEQNFTLYNQFKNKIGNEQPLHSYLSHNYLLKKISIGDLTVDDIDESFPLIDPESIALADRSYLAMGYAFIAQSNPTAAIEAFKKISLDSYFIEPALLGYGQALNDLEQYGQAKKLFDQLTFHHDVNYYVQESILASAHSSELLEDYQGALKTLQVGVEKFTQQKNALQTTQSHLTKGGTCFQVVVLKIGERSTCGKEYRGLNDLPFIEILTNSQFVTKQEQLQHINHLKTQFKHQLNKLKTYQEMLIEKKKTVQEKLNNIELTILANKVDALITRRHVVASRIRLAKENQHSFMFLPEEMRVTYTKITGAFEKLENAKAKSRDIFNAEGQKQLKKLQKYQIILNEKKKAIQIQLDNIELTRVKNKMKTLIARRDAVKSRISSVESMEGNQNNSQELSEMKAKIAVAVEDLENIQTKNNNVLKNQANEQLKKLQKYQKMLTAQKRIARSTFDNIDITKAKSKNEVLNIERRQREQQTFDEARKRLTFIDKNFKWQSDYNFTVNVHETQQNLTLLDTRLNELSLVFQQLRVDVDKVTNINKELASIDSLRANINKQVLKSDAITSVLEQEFEQKITTYFNQRQTELTQSIVAAKLAIVRMQDASFKQSQNAVPINASIPL